MKSYLRLFTFIGVLIGCCPLAFSSIKTNYHDHKVSVTVGKSITLSPYRPVGFSFDGYGFTTTVGINQVNLISDGNGTVKVEGIQVKEGVCGVYISFIKRSGFGNNDITQELHRYAVTVVELQSVSIPNSLSLFVGESSTVTPKLNPSQATSSFSWHSSDNSIASVSDDGTIKAIAPGTAKITCTTHNGKSSECDVTVKPILMQTLAISPAEVSLNVNESISFQSLIEPANTSNKSLDWSSSDDSKVIVSSSGKILAIKPGTVFISAKSRDGSNLSADAIVTVKGSNVQTIQLSQNELTMYDTETCLISASVGPDDAENKTLFWSSSNESVATVSQNGEITAHSLGITKIVASSTDGSNISATCDVTVIPTPVSSITLDKTSANLTVMETVQLSAIITPGNAHNKAIKWASSDEAIAIVDAKGLVTAKAIGTAIITATAADGSGASATCSINVVKTEANSISIDASGSTTLRIPGSVQLTAIVQPETTTDKAVTWISSNPSVASVDVNGLVTAESLGKATITATCGNVSATCFISVVATPAASVTLNKTEATLKASETVQLTAIVSPETATDKTVIWASSDVSVASVDDDGLVTAVSVGEVYISATTADGSDISTKCKIIVEPTLVESLTISPESFSGAEGDTFTINVMILPKNATNKNVVFSTNNEDVAMIDNFGKVTIGNAGFATILVETTDGSNLSAECIITGQTGIDDIFEGDITSYDVYNVNGILIVKDADKDDIRSLPNGVYLIRQGNKVKKLYLGGKH